MELDKTMTQRLRARLEGERRRLRASLDALRQGFSDAETGGIGELSLYDQHPADLGSELAARQVDLGLADNARLRLEQVERALARLEKGTYGLCEVCGRPIPPARLEAMPAATRCLTCQAAQDEAAGSPGAHGRPAPARPAEETVLAPPFGRTFDTGGWDGEDAWEDVARYGTSNSPQDAPEELSTP